MTTGSDLSAILIQLATLFVQLLPRIVACIVGFALIVGVATSDPARRRAMTGLVLIAVAIAAHFASGTIQMLMIQRAGDGVVSLQGKLIALQAVAFVVECVSAVGLVMVVSAVCAALRGRSQAAASPPMPPLQ